MATAALQARNLLPDTVGPILQEFTLDLNTGQLSLTFGETINGSFTKTGSLHHPRCDD